jgi:threonine dehydrogenase-like Zn-dependent dehydrogenase
VTGIRAAVAPAALQTEIRRFPRPEVGPDEGLLEVEACGVCGTDWEFYTRSRGSHLGPLILGHEVVGRVWSLGERAAERWKIAVGDRIVVEEFLPCGHCGFCLEGKHVYCEATESRGLKPFRRFGATPIDVPPSLWGGFAEALYLPPNALIHRIDEETPAELAALFVPISNGLHWVLEEGSFPLGGTLVVFGPGQHGLGCVVAGLQAGAGLIVAVGLSTVDAERLEAARSLGARTLEADRVDVVAAISELTGGKGADLAIDLAPGAPGTVEAALAVAAKGGTVVLAASKHGRPIEGFSNESVVRKGLTIKGVRGRNYRSVEAALGLIATRRFPLERLCTHSFALDQVDAALRVAGERTDASAIHVTVVP